MAYSKPSASTLAGQALKQTPVPSSVSLTPITIDSDIATTTELGVVKIGSGITVAVDGTISATGGSVVELGSWAPILLPSLAGNVVTSTRNANYTKIGQQVFCTFDIEVLGLSGTSSATIKLTGLPYTSIISTGYTGSVFFSYFRLMDDNVDYIGGTVISATTTADLWFTPQQDKSLVKLTQDSLKVGTRLVGTVQYISAI